MGELTSEGLQIRRLPEVVEDIVVSEQELIDSNISTEDDEVLGQLNQVIGEQIASEEALAQSVYDAFNPLKAEGVSLDNLAALIGISRIAGTASTTDKQLCTGSDGLLVTLGALIENPINGDRFSFTSALTVSVSACYSAKYSVKELLDLTEYTITINGNTVTFTSDASATELEILNGLDAYNTANYSTEPWTITVDTTNLQLIIVSDEEDDTIAISSITFISADEVSVFGNAASVEIDSIIAPSNSVTSIVTAISGWESTTNTETYVVGRERETDEELRARLLVSQQISGKGTVEAIQDSVTNTLGVSSAVVTENELTVYAEGDNIVTFTNATDKINWTANTLTNGTGVRFSSTQNLPAEIGGGVQYWVINQDTNDFEISTTFGGSVLDFTDDGTGTQKVLIGIPPKSFETVVQGGTDDDVALVIWESKPAGIETFGNTTTVVDDAGGIARTVRFTRPTAIELGFEIEYEADPEGVTPSFSEVEATIQEVVVAQTALLTIGEDVIPSRYFGPIYDELEGIILTLIQVEDTANPGFVTDRLAIGADEFATVDSGDITVTLV